jgi:hypothetical protein
MRRACAAGASNNAHMSDEPARVLDELERMIADVARFGVSPSAFAKRAKVAQTTVNRFRRDPEGQPLMKAVTLARLRAAHDAILAESAASPYLQQLTKNAKKRALIARLLTLDDAQLRAIEEAIDRIPE